jgi:hypothetical protein
MVALQPHDNRRLGITVFNQEDVESSMAAQAEKYALEACRNELASARQKLVCTRAAVG